MTPNQKAKSERLNLRLSPESDGLIREGATLSGQDVTSFMVSAALDRARSLIIEDNLVRLSPVDARDLIQAIDRETSPVPRLVELLRRTKDDRRSMGSDALSALVE